MPRQVPSAAEVSAMVAPALAGATVATFQRLEDGLTNTVLRVFLTSGEALMLRIHAAGRGAAERERALLEAVVAGGGVPAPEVLHAEGDHVVARWIDGITLDECRRSAPPALFATVAEPLGALAARVARINAPELPRRQTGVALATAQDRLRSPRVRDRLGGGTADALARLWDAHGGDLDDGGEPVLCHGDFSGRNILLRVERDRCAVAGLIDWELAFRGSALWDAGSLFRFAGRYPPPFIEGFERGHGALPRDWRRRARLLNATRLVATLALASANPGVFADSREKLVGVVAEWPG